MKYFCFLVVLLGTALSTYGQRFIEVSVSDSVLLKPKRITFGIRLTEALPDGYSDILKLSHDAGQDEYKADQIAEKQKTLNKFLATNKIAYYEKPADNLSLDAFKSQLATYYVDVKSVAEGQELLRKLTSFDGIKSGVMEITYDKQEATERALLQRIITKAKKDADLLAALSGVKLGAILEIKEVPDPGYYSSLPLNNWHDNYELMMYMKSPEFRTPYTRTFIFRFQIVD